NQFSKGNFTGLLAQSGLNVNVSAGNLSLTGKVEKYEGKEGLSGSTGLNLTDTTLSAQHADLKGSNVFSGWGFVLSNVTLTGGIDKGANTSFSSADSSGMVTNVIGNGTLNATTTEALMHNGINNTTQINVSGMTLGGTGNDWIHNYTSSKGGGWILDGATVSKTGNISLSGVGFVNSNITAGKDLTIDNKAGSLGLANTSLNASAGNITLTGNAGVSLSGNSTVTARNNITLNASAGGVSIVGTSNTTTVNITSNNGSISIDGNGSGRNLNGVEINNANLSATTGEINVTGVSDGISYYGNAGNGIALKNDVIFTSTKNTLTGRYNNLVSDTGSYTGAISVGAAGLANITFVGNTAIEATSKYAAGLLFNPMYGPSALLTFKGGNYTISGKTTENGAINATNSAGIANQAWNNKPVQPEFRVENGTLNISASGNDVDGMASFRPNAVDSPDDGARGSGYKFSGAGNVNINATSVSGNGINLRDFDNTGMTGTLTITGSSQSGSGVTVPEWGNVSLVNTTITGSSQTGTGILMNAGDSHSKKIDLNGNTLNGTSASGTGININGNNVSVANGSLTGTSQGSGAGVQLTGGSNYTVDGATVTGTSAGGAGVSVDGNLSVANGTVKGDTVTGSGVNISGNLSTTNTTINGNASGNGTGVSLSGNVTGDTTDKSIITGDSASGTGVAVSGDHSVSNVTINGATVNGTGIGVTGNLTSTGSVLNGNATGTGTGVDLA
ncbi:S-layer family protein, partial [Salmonella enterica]